MGRDSFLSRRCVPCLRMAPIFFDHAGPGTWRRQFRSGHIQHGWRDRRFDLGCADIQERFTRPDGRRGSRRRLERAGRVENAADRRSCAPGRNRVTRAPCECCPDIALCVGCTCVSCSSPRVRCRVRGNAWPDWRHHYFPLRFGSDCHGRRRILGLAGGRHGNCSRRSCHGQASHPTTPRRASVEICKRPRQLQRWGSQTSRTAQRPSSEPRVCSLSLTHALRSCRTQWAASPPSTSKP